ncbi:hypothetical protein DDE83_006748 [Stemphylium lycopersici]|uniref:Uncharacterized protein n=1 Tax=Stemphylium lycopersici TaxID=183478 RepID=A0A364MY08_STELY|nr:hypothetical protein DDE83_006748 [Stemphylium lycopersici]
MSSKLISLIYSIKDRSPLPRKSQPNPRDGPMYYRPGITMGRHLEEFAGFKDAKDRSFEQLIYSTLHGSSAASEPLLQPQRETSKMSAGLKKPATLSVPGSRPVRAVPSQEKVSIDDYMKMLQYEHLDDIRKSMISGPAVSQKRKREEEEEEEDVGKESKQKNKSVNTPRCKRSNGGDQKKRKTGLNFSCGMRRTVASHQAGTITNVIGHLGSLIPGPNGM